jgi:hypothetical protein
MVSNGPMHVEQSNHSAAVYFTKNDGKSCCVATLVLCEEVAAPNSAYQQLISGSGIAHFKETVGMCATKTQKPDWLHMHGALSFCLTPRALACGQTGDTCQPDCQ